MYVVLLKAHIKELYWVQTTRSKEGVKETQYTIQEAAVAA